MTAAPRTDRPMDWISSNGKWTVTSRDRRCARIDNRHTAATWFAHDWGNELPSAIPAYVQRKAREMMADRSLELEEAVL